ncbi:hypothetical protein DYBT9275_02103 [Dyadobacter sp. CECT 9275]|uniref:Por secretion system C-terminal sorting domain-containing protein n=1 Tax=Dyadobacter helix TaxID=2822344 RepID=A0A916NC06_9BACT|nr:T9SS type A sorting domain-containing protein [Dyadobacter sp. CECT 9275]CAG4998896.1 hypothetical protein DYBT9275_02103 [Dyadobacter sp. CECT 9275]
MVFTDRPAWSVDKNGVINPLKPSMKAQTPQINFRTCYHQLRMNLSLNRSATVHQVKTGYIRSLLIILLSTSLCTSGFSQRFFSVVFNKLPQDYQLYPRDEKNEAKVPISGIVETLGYNYVSVQVLRNNTLLKYVKSELKYDGKGIGSFALETTIKAELAEYTFKVYACKTGDSTLVVTRNNVVSGDTYIIMGQSNSTGFFGESETDEYCRTFGRITDNLNTDPYKAADTLWSISNKEGYYNNVGTMGFEIQKQLSQKYGIPNCLISAGFHWSSAYSHAIRNEQNPTDFSTGYGRMLYRVQKAGLASSAKTFIYRQGETETYHEGSGWEENFGKLREHLKMDLPSLTKLYVFQIDIIYYPSPVGALIRDYQRRLPEIYSDVQSLATVGTQDFDGLHYGKGGNKQSGVELSRIIGKDFYGSQDTANIYSPAVKKIFYKTAEKKEIVLVFDEGQELVYPDAYKPNGNTTLDMKDFFYLDGSAGAVASGTVDQNRIILSLKSSQNASRLNYLPSYVTEGGAFYPYTGPYIKNKLGMRAFSFFEVSIGKALEVPVLRAEIQTPLAVALSWNSVADAGSYLLERKSEGESTYHTIARMGATVTTYTDAQAPLSGKITYRIKAINTISESGDYGIANVEVPVVTGIQEPGLNFLVFPNPVIKSENLTIQFSEPVTGTISLLDQTGQQLEGIQIRRSSEGNIHLKNLMPGFYIVSFVSEKKQLYKKIVVTP